MGINEEEEASNSVAVNVMAGYMNLYIGLVIWILASACEARRRGGGGLGNIDYCFVWGCPVWGWALTILAFAIICFAISFCCYWKFGQTKQELQEDDIREQQSYFGHGQPQPPNNSGQSMANQDSLPYPVIPLQEIQQPNACSTRQHHVYSQHVNLEDSIHVNNRSVH